MTQTSNAILTNTDNQTQQEPNAGRHCIFCT